MNNKLNSFMDHVWDGFYTGQLRKSRFPGLVYAPKGSVYDITYTGTPAKKQKYMLKSQDKRLGLTVRIAYPSAESRQIRKNGKRVDMNQWDEYEKMYGSIKQDFCKPVREDAKDWGSKLRQSLEEFESGRRQHEKDKTKQKKVAAANALLQRKEMIAKAEAETAVQPETVSVAAPKLTPSSSKVTTTTTTTIQAVDFPSIPKLTREQSSLAMLAKRNLIQQSVTRVSLDRTSSREIPDDF